MLTTPDSECLSLSLLFCPLTLQELQLTFFSFDSMLNTSCLWCLSLLPFPFVVAYQKVGLRAIEQPHSITGLLMPVFETRQEEEIKILAPLFLITYSWLRALACIKPWLLMGERHSSWGMNLLCTRLHWLKIKLTFRFSPKIEEICLRIFHLFQ